MAETGSYGEDSASVQTHLNIIQSAVQRMASNSASCKAWCITLVSAVLVIVADKGKPDYALIAFIPTLLFLVLDTYYLALERCFRQSYNQFIEKLHAGRVAMSDLYAVSPAGSLFKTFMKSLSSFSIWPFYGTLAAMILIARRVVIGS